MSSGIRMVVGLGNPGAEYGNTPHNIGFEVLDTLAGRHGLRFRRALGLPAWDAVWQKGDSSFLLLKPRTFMNESGRAVARAMAAEKLSPEQVLVVYDDLALPLGRMRLRKNGSAGGHNGVSSVIQSLGGRQDFPRLRVGVGPRPPGDALVSYVLSPWPKDLTETVETSRERGADALEHLLREGFDATMNLYNAG